MARKPRIGYKGCLYHVMDRRNNGEFILLKDEEKQIYLSLVKKYKEKYLLRLYAYCIMDNHKVPLSKIKSRSSKGTEYVVEVIRRAENKGISQA